MLKQLIAAAALAVSVLTVQAGEVQNDLGVLDSSEELSFSAQGSSQDFFHLYHFELGAPVTLSGSFDELVGVVLYSVKLASDGGYRWFQLGADNTFKYENLPEGYYALYVFGTTADGLSSFNGSLVTQPVPEPDTYAMLLGGLGLMGAFAARRRKSV